MFSALLALAAPARAIETPYEAVRLERSSPGGDYEAGREMLDGCVRVRYGERGLAQGGSRFDHAFVSSRNGFVYRSLRECRLSR